MQEKIRRRWNPVRGHWQGLGYLGSVWYPTNGSTSSAGETIIVTYADTWAEEESGDFYPELKEAPVYEQPKSGIMLAAAKESDIPVHVIDQDGLEPKRHLGICEDGPLEILRVFFTQTPAVGDRIRISAHPSFDGRPTYDRSLSPQKTYFDRIWVLKGEQWHIYRVTATSHDGRGDFSSLRHQHSVTP